VFLDKKPHQSQQERNIGKGVRSFMPREKTSRGVTRRNKGGSGVFGGVDGKGGTVTTRVRSEQCVSRKRWGGGGVSGGGITIQ